MEQEDILKKLNESSKECVIKNRRKGPDFWLQLINLVGLIIWGGWLALFSICDRAGVKLFDLNQTINDVKNVLITFIQFGGIMLSTSFATTYSPPHKSAAITRLVTPTAAPCLPASLSNIKSPIITVLYLSIALIS